jgi:tetratricopeptide (TPR) repeat protein
LSAISATPTDEKSAGFAARQRGDRHAALAHFRAAAVVTPDDVWAVYESAIELLALGRLDEAEAAFRDVAKRDPSAAVAWRDLGRIARRRGDRQAALAHFQAGASLKPDDAWMLLELAAELSEFGRLDEAEAEACRAASLDMDAAPFASRSLGSISRRRGDREAALAHFRDASEAKPDDPWTLVDVATELVELSRIREARSLLEDFLARKPASTVVLLRLADVARRDGKPDEALDHLLRAQTIEPRDPSVRLELATEFVRRGKLGEADSLYDTLLAEATDDIAALKGKAQVARGAGDRAAALVFLQRAAATPAASGWEVAELSRELADAGRFEDAERVLNEALARNPSDIACLMQLGLNARSLGDRVCASAAFASAQAVSSGSACAAIEQAVEQFHLGHAVEAIAAVEALASPGPGKTQALTTLAHFHENLGNWGLAVELRRRVVDADPTNLWPRLEFARGLGKLGRFQEALRVMALCESRFGQAPEIAVVKAGLLSDSGDIGAARIHLQRAVECYPSHFEIWYHYVNTLISCGAFEEAWRATRAPPDCSARDRVRVHVLRGQLSMSQWCYKEALAHFLEALGFNPSDSWVNELATRASLQGADVESARRHHEISVRTSPSHRLFYRGAVRPWQAILGQLIDEYRMDRESLTRLQEAMASSDAIATLRRLVLERPDYTPAAIALFLSLRRENHLTSLAGFRRESPGRIPKAIVQYWNDDLPPDVAALCETWRAKHPTYEYNLFSRAEARRFLVETTSRQALAAFDRAREPATQADIFRLAWLCHRGGWYVDADDRCVAPLCTMDPGTVNLVVHQEDWSSIGNNVIGAVASHPALASALEHAVEAVNRDDKDIVWLSTGPGLLTRRLAVYLAEDLDERLPEILVLELHEIRRAVAMHCAATYKTSNRHWTSRAPRGSGALTPR